MLLSKTLKNLNVETQKKFQKQTKKIAGGKSTTNSKTSKLQMPVTQKERKTFVFPDFNQKETGKV